MKIFDMKKILLIFILLTSCEKLPGAYYEIIKNHVYIKDFKNKTIYHDVNCPECKKEKINMDICKCSGEGCPLKFTCYRFISDSDIHQNYFIDPPYDHEKKNCDFEFSVKKILERKVNAQKNKGLDQ